MFSRGGMCSMIQTISLLQLCKKLAMYFLQSLFIWLAMFQMTTVGEHILDSHNEPADVLFHNNISFFICRSLTLVSKSSEIPQEHVEQF